VSRSYEIAEVSRWLDAVRRAGLLPDSVARDPRSIDALRRAVADGEGDAGGPATVDATSAADPARTGGLRGQPTATSGGGIDPAADADTDGGPNAPTTVGERSADASRSGAVGRFLLRRELGEGGMGVVWSARDARLRRTVAVKTLRRFDERTRARFVEEAQIAGQLQHPNIVPIHELDYDADGAPFLVMKRIRGESLDEVLDRLDAAVQELEPGEPDIVPGVGRAPTLVDGADGGADEPPPVPQRRRARDISRRRFTEPVLGAHTPAEARIRLLLIFGRICDAVAYAHARGVIHRDLKPGNIMVGEFGEVLVLDWGLAKLIRGGDETWDASESGPRRTGDGESSTQLPAVATDARRSTSTAGGDGVPAGPLIAATIDDSVSVRTELADDESLRTADGVVKGTVAYMSPEQAAGRISDLDERSDIYSLGAMLYELLTLMPPVSGPIRPSLAKIIRGEFPPPRDRAPELGIPRDLDAITRRAMARRPEDRYATVQALKGDVEAFIAGRAVEARDYTPAQKLMRFAARHRRGLATAAALLILAVAAALIVPRVLADAVERDRAEKLAERVATARGEAMGLIATLDALTPPDEARALTDLDAALAAHADFIARTRDDAAALAANDALQAADPALAARMLGLADEATDRRVGLLRDWAARHLRDVETGAPSDERIAELFHAFRAHARREELPDLPVADFALELVRRAIDAGAIEDAARWTAAAYAASPTGPATGTALLAMTDALYRRDSDRASGTISRHEHIALLDGTMQRYHRVFSWYADRHPQLWPAAMLGLARAAVNGGALPAGVGEMSGEEFALRCVLQIITPDGRLRPRVAAALDERASRRIRREARHRLIVLRRMQTAIDYHAEDLDGDGIFETAVRRETPGRFGVATIPPPGAGFEAVATPTGWTTVDCVKPLAAAAGVSRDGLEGPGAPIGPLWLGHPFDPTRKTLWFSVPTPAGQTAVAFDSALGGEPVAIVPIGRGGLATGDVDGDGRTDVVATDHATSHVAFQADDGGFLASRQLEYDTDAMSRLGLAPVDTSYTLSSHWHDLDRDGRLEFAMTLGEWNHLALIAFRAGRDGTLTALDQRRIGAGRAMVRDNAFDGATIETLGSLTREHQRVLHIISRYSGEEYAPVAGYARWRLVDDKLRQVPLPEALKPLVDPQGNLRHAVLDGEPVWSAGHIWRSWTISTGSVRVRVGEEPDGASLLDMSPEGEAFVAQPDERFVETRGRWYRALGDAELREFESLTIPPLRPVTASHETVLTVKTLIAFGIVDPALDAAFAALAGGQSQTRPGAGERVATNPARALTEEERVYLIETAARLAQRDSAGAGVPAYDELLRVLDLPVGDTTIDAALDVAGRAALESGRYREVADVLTEAADRATALSIPDRKRIHTLIAHLQAPVWGERPAIDVRADGIGVRGEAGATRIAPLHDHVITSHISAADLITEVEAEAPIDAGRVFSLRLGEPGPSGGLIQIADGATAEAEPRFTTDRQPGDWFAVPVEVGSGSLRIVADIRLRGADWHSDVRIGLFDPAAIAGGQAPAHEGITLAVGGSNSDNVARVRVYGPHLPRACGTWFRIEYRWDDVARGRGD
jgi:serine/threonine protein kinase